MLQHVRAQGARGEALAHKWQQQEGRTASHMHTDAVAAALDDCKKFQGSRVAGGLGFRVEVSFRGCTRVLSGFMVWHLRQRLAGFRRLRRGLLLGSQLWDFGLKGFKTEKAVIKLRFRAVQGPCCEGLGLRAVWSL